MMKRMMAVVFATLGAGCDSEQMTQATMGAPGLEGPLTMGRWEQRQKDGLSFWPPNPDESRLPELIDFSCVENTTDIRLTVTGDMDRTGLWIAEDRRSARRIVLQTEEGIAELQLHAGQQRLPSIQIPIDAEYLQPLSQPGGRFAINAFGTRIYRMEVVPEIADTIAYCAKGARR